MRGVRSASLVLIAVATAACSRASTSPSAPRPHRISQTGTASWYGPGFNGKATTSGESYDQNAFTAAHRTFPLGSRVRVTNTANERSVDVRINDRGPFVGNRIIDLSYAAADALGMIGPGTADVVIEVLETPVALTAVPTSIRYAVQAGSYTTREAADAARERVSRSAREVTVVAARVGSQTLYRVRIGDFPDVNAAKDEAARLKGRGIETVVVER